MRVVPFKFVSNLIRKENSMANANIDVLEAGSLRFENPPSPKNHKNIGFFCKTGQDPLNNHKATKPAFNVGPSSACQRNPILLAGQ